jgi:hypothetical protein
MFYRQLEDFGLILSEGFFREMASEQDGERRVRTIGTYI